MAISLLTPIRLSAKYLLKSLRCRLISANGECDAGAKNHSCTSGVLLEQLCATNRSLITSMPGKVLIHSRPVHPDAKAKQYFFDWKSANHHTAERRKIPRPCDIAGSHYFQRN